jgi:FimV-like protein
MKHIVYVIITSFFIANSYALELSHITLNSKLNEPLKAQIKVSSIPKNSISSLKVQLASTSNFKRAGIETVAFLEKLQFSIENTDNTLAIINITSKEIVKERVLNFLIQLNWTGGRILREYALLLAPPLYKKSKDNFYTVTQDDSLWKIADKTRSKGKTVKQQMLNIFNTNKNAFVKENMNLLRVGARLKIAILTENIPIAPETAQVKQEPVILPVDSSPRLHITTPKADEKIVNDNIVKLRNQVNQLLEKNTSIESENGYLKQELSKNHELLVAMKKQLDDMNKMVVLQNKQLSELQIQLNQQQDKNQRLQTQQHDTKEWLNSPLAWLSIGAMMLLLLLIFFIIKIMRSNDNESNYVPQLAMVNDAKNEVLNDDDGDLSTGITDELEKYLKGESALSLEKELSDVLSLDNNEPMVEEELFEQNEEPLSLSEECYFSDYENNYPVELAPENNDISLDKQLILEEKLIEDDELSSEDELFLKNMGDEIDSMDDMLEELSLANESIALSLNKIYAKELAL